MLKWLVLVVLVFSVGLTGCTSVPDSERMAIAVTPQKYKVRRGDTLLSIAWRYQLDYRSLAHWNGLRKPYVIYPGQRLIVNPPRGYRQLSKAASPPETKENNRQKPPNITQAPTVVVPSVARDKVEPRKPQTTHLPSPSSISWSWPTRGTVVQTFQGTDQHHSGIGIRGVEGQPVLAASSGVVVYSGAALKGYGELIIISHTDSLLSAYGHNRHRYVVEGQIVEAGQTIAQMGKTNAKIPLLHFEIRVNGQPVDPLKYVNP